MLIFQGVYFTKKTKLVSTVSRCHKTLLICQASAVMTATLATSLSLQRNYSNLLGNSWSKYVKHVNNLTIFVDTQQNLELKGLSESVLYLLCMAHFGFRVKIIIEFFLSAVFRSENASRAAIPTEGWFKSNRTCKKRQTNPYQENSANYLEHRFDAAARVSSSYLFGKAGKLKMALVEHRKSNQSPLNQTIIKKTNINHLFETSSHHRHLPVIL